MSTVYNLEPPTQGKVTKIQKHHHTPISLTPLNTIPLPRHLTLTANSFSIHRMTLQVVLHTTLGDLDIELWAKEAPKAVRNFVQLCLEGYYDNTIFHRIIKDFLMQGGDPTGTGQGGESIYEGGRPFKDEFHTRLRFSHRGLVACANQNKPDTNSSQFFITLDRTDSLERKSTIFGRIAGDTIYNLNRFNEQETDRNDIPLEPPRIVSIEVLWNPFDDIKPRMTRQEEEEKAKAEAAAAAVVLKKEQKQKGRNFKLISFGDEAEEEEEDALAASARLKIKSAHDALEDKKLGKQAAVEVDLQNVRERLGKVTNGGRGGGGSAIEKMKARIKQQQEAAGLQVVKEKEVEVVVIAEEDKKGGQVAAAAAEDEEEYRDQTIKKRKKSSSKQLLADQQYKSQKVSTAAIAPSKQITLGTETELLTSWERKRKEYKEKRRLGGNREKETLDKLAKFQATLKRRQPKAPTTGLAVEYTDDKDKVSSDPYVPAAWRIDGFIKDDDVDDDQLNLHSLRQHKLEFTKDHLVGGDKHDDYTVVDPLADKEHHGGGGWNDNREKKRGREWNGRSK
jgi:peptidyl-prolyl cis-trans isomerase SDCCAG10